MPLLPRKIQSHLRYIVYRGDVINLRVIMGNPLAQFLRRVGLAGEVNLFDDAAVAVDVSNCRLTICHGDVTTGHKAHPAEKRGEQNQQDGTELLLHRD